MCGIVAAFLANADASVSPELYEALTLLQHRGQVYQKYTLNQSNHTRRMLLELLLVDKKVACTNAKEMEWFVTYSRNTKSVVC
jgi:glutamine phosphoribosylpyrophosphate amidotransferase